MRICSLVPSATEILCALGLGEDIVGVSHECDFPPGIAGKPRVLRTSINQDERSSLEIDQVVRASSNRSGSLYQINEALLARLAPDLVITQSLCEVCAVDAASVEKSVRAVVPRAQVVSLHPHTIEELFKEIRMLGHVTNRSVQARGLVAGCLARLEQLKRSIPPQSERLRVFCLEWLNPPMASGHWVPEMVACAGGREVLGRAGQPSRYVTWEEIASAAPEVVVLMPCGFPIERTRREVSLLTAQPAWSALPAVRTGRVYLVDGPAYFNRSGPRLIDGIELLAGLFHPDRCGSPILAFPSADQAYLNKPPAQEGLAA